MNRHRLTSERGQALALVALGLVMLVSMMGLVIDFGYALSVRHALQASTDAAAAAGAMETGATGINSANATAKATQYSSVPGNKNARASMSNVAINVQVKCTNYIANLMTGANCTTGATPANTIVVTQTATIPTFFAKVIGYQTLTVQARTTAAMKGGGMPPLDIAIVLDTTGSMDGSCSGSIPGVSHPTRLDCAKAGIRTLLKAFWPCPPAQGACGGISNGNVANPIDKVGFLLFPGLRATTPVSKEFDCTRNVAQGDISPYGASPNYNIVPLVSDYKTSAFSNLNGSVSNLVKAVDWTDGNTCGSGSYGAENPGGQGSYFADAITAAQNMLVNTGRSTVQDVIIFVSDGDANRYSTGSGRSQVLGPANPCHVAITAADAAASAGTWVYAVAYGASAGGGCGDDSPNISPYATMQGIASDPQKFFSTPSSGNLTGVFEKIGQSLLTTRLLDNSTS